MKRTTCLIWCAGIAALFGIAVMWRILWYSSQFSEQTALWKAAKTGDVQRLSDGLKMRPAMIWYHYNPNDYPGGQTLLHAACAKGQAEAVQLLLSKGADPNARDNPGVTPLINAVNSDAPVTDRLQCIDLLLAAGADVNSRQQDGQDALQIAIYIHRPALVRRLAAAGALINRGIGKEGWTSLHWACVHGESQDRLTIIKILLEAGADRLAKDKSGRTPSDLAQGYKVVQSLLENAEDKKTFSREKEK